MPVPIVVNGVYAVKYGNNGRDSTTLPKPYALKLTRQSSKKGGHLHDDKLDWVLVGTPQTARTRTSGKASIPGFQKLAIRQLSDDEVKAFGW